VELVFGMIEQDKKTRRGCGQGLRETRTDIATGAGNQNALAGVSGASWIASGQIAL
jgi:hypothetical protein